MIFVSIAVLSVSGFLAGMGVYNHTGSPAWAWAALAGAQATGFVAMAAVLPDRD